MSFVVRQSWWAIYSSGDLSHSASGGFTSIRRIYPTYYLGNLTLPSSWEISFFFVITLLRGGFINDDNETIGH